MRSVVLVLLVALGSDARANQAQEHEARELFDQASTAFHESRYDRAYDLFKRSYLLFPAPELLFNMASALQSAGRPHDAADSLRAFLRVRPDANERAAIEARIRALEEAQRLLDAQRVLHDPAPEIVAVPTKSTPHWTRRKTLITALATTGGVIVLGGIATGVVLGLHDWHTSSELGTHGVTP